MSLILLRAASIPVSGKTPSVDNKMHFYEQFVDPLQGGIVGNMREVLGHRIPARAALRYSPLKLRIEMQPRATGAPVWACVSFFSM